jgi:hypothetical protein
MRRRSFHSSPVVGAKGNSRSLPSVIKSDGLLYGVNKTKLHNRVVRLDTLTSDFKQALLANCYKEAIQNKKYYNIIEYISQPQFLILCYNLIKSKAGSMTPGTTSETLDGLTLN